MPAGAGQAQIRALTAPDAAAAAQLGCEVGAIANSLVFDADGHPVLVLTSGAHRVDTAYLAAALGLVGLRLCWRRTPESVLLLVVPGVVLSGGPESVNLDDPPKVSPTVFGLGVPILGICYGLHTMAAQLGGKVEPSDDKEFGYAEVELHGHSALFEGITVLFLAQVFGIDLSVNAMLLVVLVAVGASIGTPATPGVGIVILAMVLSTAGVPLSGVALILGVDRILDMCRTAINVAGDLVTCLLADRWVEQAQPDQEAPAEAIANAR